MAGRAGRAGRAQLAVYLLVAVLALGAHVSSKSTAATRSRPHAMAPNGLSAASGPRIVGGYDAQPGEFPYQVSVRSRSRKNGYGHFCGGAVLTYSVVVTAAHCVSEVQGSEIGNLYIVAGSNQLSGGGVTRYVERKLVHPDYGPVYQDYDIALLWLTKPLPDDVQVIAPVRLQTTEGLPSGISCKASGWGHTSETDTKLPDKLQAVVLPIIDFDICAAYYEAETDYSPVIESQLCAGFEEGRRDACQGDSGGPLVCNDLLTGIVSWGSGCAQPRFPGVYSDVAFLRPWIEENVNSTTDGPTGAATPSTLPIGLLAATSLAFVVLLTASNAV